jgi:hypothetical protein
MTGNELSTKPKRPNGQKRLGRPLGKETNNMLKTIEYDSRMDAPYRAAALKAINEESAKMLQRTEVSSGELVRLRWRNKGPDMSGYWLRFDGAMHADFVTEKDLKVESEQPGYLGQGMWCGPIERPNVRTEVSPPARKGD